MAGLVSALWKPPLRLRAMPDQWARWLRPLWILLFGFSVLVVTSGLAALVAVLVPVVKARTHVTATQQRLEDERAAAEVEGVEDAGVEVEHVAVEIEDDLERALRPKRAARV